MFQFQKSREKWIWLGSKNITFFQTQTIIIKKHNKIYGLMLPYKEWCTKDSILKKEVGKLFKALFCFKDRLGMTLTVWNLDTLSYEARSSLVNPMLKKKAFQALMSMKSYKSLRPDEFQSIFFKMFQDKVGDEVWQFVAKAFETSCFDVRVSKTLLTLIPKGDTQKTFNDFHPTKLVARDREDLQGYGLP